MVYLPTNLSQKSTIHVGKYTSRMDPSWDKKPRWLNEQISSRPRFATQFRPKVFNLRGDVGKSTGFGRWCRGITLSPILMEAENGYI